jgi:SAM-dependent methyltransferase
MRFTLDTPAGRDVDRVTRFSGWCLTAAGQPVNRIFLRANGLAAAQMERSPRWDLVTAFPDFPEAALGGFAGDLALPERMRTGDRCEVELVAQHEGVEHALLKRTYRLATATPAPTPRRRSYRFEDILEQTPAVDAWDSARDPHGNASWPARVLTVPHFHDAGTVPTLRVLEHGPTNAYSSGAIEVMDTVPVDGVFLDLGCGIRREQDLRANGVYLDAVHFRSVDVVSSRARLPLRDACMDAVVSLGVFEHLPDPFGMAREIHRVLKPGGTVWIETAFMQPMHADPSHYFNMTAEGLLRVASGFAIEECGIQSHQMPSFALLMQLDQALAYMRDGNWKHTLSDWQARIRADAAGLNEALGPIARRSLAAGVYIRGRKPA